MQQHGGTPADEAISGGERQFRVSILVDWNKNGAYNHALTNLSSYISDVSTDRSLRGSAPEEVLLIEGSSAAELSFTLGGEYDDIPFTAVFSPYNGFSPFYLKDIIGAEVKYAIGVETSVGVIWYEQFVGNIRTISPDRASNSVVITALDRVEVLRKPIRFVPWAFSDYGLTQGAYVNQTAYSNWIIDNCLRHCDVSTTPWRPQTRAEMGVPDGTRDGTLFWLTGNGSLLPTIGYLDNVNVQRYFPDSEVMYEASAPLHPGSADTAVPAWGFRGGGDDLASSETNVYWVSNRDLINDIGTHWMGMTLHTTAETRDTLAEPTVRKLFEIAIGPGVWIRIVVGDGNIRTEQYRVQPGGTTTLTSSAITIPPTGDHQRIIAIWDNTPNTGTRVYLRCGTANTGGWETVGPPWTGSTATGEFKGQVEVLRVASMSDLYYVTRNQYGTAVKDEAGVPAKYAASVDLGMNRLSFMPTLRDDAWNVITAVASAEMGSVFWDEFGTFRFWNYNHIVSMREIAVRTLSTDEVSNLSMTHSLDSVRNIWTVTAAKRRAAFGVVYESRDADEFYTPGGTVKTFRVAVDRCMSPLPQNVTQYTTVPSGFFPDWSDGVQHGYVVQYLVSGVWQEDTTRAGVDVKCYFDDEGNLVVRVWNGWDEPTRLASNDGRSKLRVAGSVILDSPDVIVEHRDRPSIAKYGSRSLGLSGPWVQDVYNASSMVTTLMERTTQPIPTTDAIEIAGDPRLQMGDTLEIVDSNGIGETARVQIYGISRRWSLDTGLTDTLTVEMIRPAGTGIWDSPQYGRWDETFNWSD